MTPLASRNMVAGLLDIPPEIQLQIAELMETGQTLKALSVTCRSLHSIAQSLLFETFRIDLGMPLRGSIDDLLVNQQICAAIRDLEVGRFSSLIPHNNNEQLSLIQQLLPKLVRLRRVLIYQVHLSKAFMASFLEIAAKIPLEVMLIGNIYQSDISTMTSAPLRISHLHLGSSINQPSLNFYRTVVRASAATLTELYVRADGDGLMYLANIDLPYLHTFNLLIIIDSELVRKSAAAFITVQKTIRVLDLDQNVCPLPPLPPSALPDLQELRGSAEMVKQLVPGRPVEVIEVFLSGWSDQDWFGEEVARSTAAVRKLRVHLNTALREMPMVKRMVVILPSLESLWLSVYDDVSGPFTRDPLDSFPFRHSSKLSKLSKFSLLSSASQSYELVCIFAKHG